MRLGPYQIIEELGKGGMGIVYKAIDTRIQHTVAIKVLHNNISDIATKRFVQEGQLMARLRHPDILKLYEINNYNNRIYLIMEFVKRQPLSKYIQSVPFDTTTICSIFSKIANAIQFIHSAEIIHRDLKPDNIMIDSENNIKIMDFGLARFLNDDKQFSQSGMIMGTLHYMPPEQADGNLKLVDKRSDVYALGAILYEMITRQKVFSGNNVVELVCKIHEQVPISPKTINPSTPDNLQKVCLKALEKKQENRYQSAGTFADDIIKVQNGEPIELSVGFKSLLLQTVLQNKKILFVFVAACLIFLSLYIFNYLEKKQINDKAIHQLYSQAIDTLSTNIENSIDWEYTITTDVDKIMLSYIEAGYYLNQAYKINPNYTFVNDKILEVYSNICILSTLVGDYAVAEFYLQTYNEIDHHKGKLMASKIIEYKNRLQEQHEQKIKLMLGALAKTPEEGELEEYVFQASKLKSHHTVKLLLSYINSPIEWQRLFTIQVLGNLADLNTTYEEKNSGDCLSEHLTQLKFPQQIYEIKMVIWSLGKLRYSKSLEIVKKVRSQFPQENPIYKETEQPYLWLLHK